jgi:hypothetical protein
MAGRVASTLSGHAYEADLFAALRTKLGSFLNKMPVPASVGEVFLRCANRGKDARRSSREFDGLYALDLGKSICPTITSPTSRPDTGKQCRMRCFDCHMRGLGPILIPKQGRLPNYLDTVQL